MKKFYESLREQMIKTMQKSLPEIRKALGLGVAEFADRLGVTRQTINNLETVVSEEESGEAVYKRQLMPPMFLAICLLVDTLTEDDWNRVPYMKMQKALVDNEGKSEDEIPIFWRIDRCQLRKKWILTFPLKDDLLPEKFTSDDVNIFQIWRSICENFYLIIDASILKVLEVHQEFFGLLNELDRSGNMLLVPSKTLYMITSQCEKLFKYEKDLDSMNPMKKGYYDIYNALAQNGLFPNCKVLKKHFENNSQSQFGTIGIAGVNLQKHRNPILRLINNPVEIMQESQDESAGVFDQMQRLGKTFRVAFLTADDEMIDKVTEFVKGETTSNHAEFKIIKYIKNPRENGFFTVVDPGKTKESNPETEPKKEKKDNGKN